MNIVTLSPDHTDALTEFFARLPDEDLTLMREDVTEPDIVRGWADRPAHWVARRAATHRRLRSPTRRYRTHAGPPRTHRRRPRRPP